MIKVTQETIDKLKRSVSIPSRPSILQKLEAELSRPEPDIDNVADLIAQDVGLSAGILTILNSPAYGLTREIRDVRHGAMILGLQSIKAMATAYFLKGAFDQSKCCVLLEPFWDNAAKVAQATTKIGKMSYCNISTELMYLGGLFHNCGVPVMAIRYQDYGITLVEASEDNKRTLVDIETERYDCSHNVVGYYLARTWRLPKSVCLAILHVQDLDLFKVSSDPELRAIFAVIKAAENAVSVIREDKELTEWQTLCNPSLSELELTKQEYTEVIDELSVELRG